MTIFQITRMHLFDLIGLYLTTRPDYLAHGGHTKSVAEYVAAMTREQMVAAIVATAAGKRLLREGA
jgi:hypothetical protein